MADLVWVRIFSQTSRLELEIFSLTYNGVRFFFFQHYIRHERYFFQCRILFFPAIYILASFSHSKSVYRIHLSREFYRRVKVISLFHRVIYTCVPQGKHIVNVSFPKKRFDTTLFQYLLFPILAMKMLAATAIFVPMVAPWVCKQLLPQNWNEFSVNI